MKRLVDVVGAALGLTVMSPLLAVFMLLIWLQDFRPPVYIAPRVLRRGETFRMVKLRSMVMHADKIGGASTSATDARITWVGSVVRRFKLDEFTQLWNVFRGEMSLVGPRPQVQRDVNLYTEEEYRLFSVKPGITDFASVVFADEGEILRGSDNPDLKYNQVIRPWKSRLGLFYADHHRLSVDGRLILLTVVAIFSRKRALAGVQRLLRSLDAPSELIRMAGRNEPLQPHAPPGAAEIEWRT